MMYKWRYLALLGLALALTLVVAGVAAAAPLHQERVVHVVAWGDTLFSIARRHGTTVDAIRAANELPDATRIYAGQRLTIPTSPAPTVPSDADATHVVQPGENVFRIAQRYGTTVQALVEINGLHNAAQIVAGQELIIPGSATAPSVAYQPQHASTTHTVQPGETLFSIAHRYGVQRWTLIQVNNIANPALIVPGQTLTIPNADSLASAPSSSSSAAGGKKRIVVDLSEQHLYAYQGDALVHSFVASTGRPGTGTRTGTFRVLDKIPNAYASTWDLQMPHWLGIYWAGPLENGIHALPILSNGERLWEGYLGTPVSYGCVVLGTEEARTLYAWAEVGIPVVIRR